MKKTITTALVLLSVSIFSVHTAFGQDTTKMKNDNEEAEDQTEAQKKHENTKGSYVALGIEAGLNMTDFLYSQGNGGITSKTLPRGRAGVLLDIPIHGVFYIQPGVFYAMNGHGDNNTTNINAVEVPVNLMFKFQMRDRSYLFVGAGPFVGYNISGTEAEGTFRIGSANTDNIKALDYGIGANLGYELKCGLFFRARYQWGLANLQPQSNSYISTINSESYGIQVGYFFGRRAHMVQGMQQQPKVPNVWDE